MTAMLASSNPLTHVVQHVWGEPIKLADSGVFSTFTVMSNQIFMMVLAAFLLIVFVIRAGRRRRGNTGMDALVASGFGNFIETICVYLRDEVAKPALGEHTESILAGLERDAKTKEGGGRT